MLMAATAQRVKHQMPRPKNGKYPVILIAGGPADRARELRDIFAERRGILAKHHWPYQRPHAWDREIPSDVDWVLFLKTQSGHAEHAKLMAAAKRAGVPVVRTSHKWTAIDLAMRARWSDAHKAAPLPLVLRSTAAFYDEDPEPAPATVVQLRAEPPAAQPKLEQLAVLARRDFVTVVRELQQLMVEAGIPQLLVSRSEVTVQTTGPVSP